MYFNLSPDTTWNQNLGRIPRSTWDDQDGPLVRASRWLSQVTRHTMVGAGLTWDEAGWFKVEQIFTIMHTAFIRHFPNPRTFEFVIHDNPGKRFELSWSASSGYLVRAVHGHSLRGMNPHQALRQVRIGSPHGFSYDLPRERRSEQPGGPIYTTQEMCVHGTTLEAANSIIRLGPGNGLIPGGPQGIRKAVHFATSLPKSNEEMISGLRQKSEVLIFFNLEKWLLNGKEAFASERFVICIFERIPREYIMAAIRVWDGTDLMTMTKRIPEPVRDWWAKYLSETVDRRKKGHQSVECDSRPPDPRARLRAIATAHSKGEVDTSNLARTSSPTGCSATDLSGVVSTA